MRVQACKTESEWLEARRDGIGASEAGVVYGLPGYRSLRRIWAYKVGEKFGLFDNKPNDLAELGEAGHRSEPMNDIWFFDKTGLKTVDPGDYTIYWADGPVPLFCTPDRIVLDKSNTPIAVLELKAAFHRQAKIWKFCVPESYMIQVQHQLYCTGLDTAYISVLMNGYEHKWFKIERHERTIKEILRRSEWFWGFVRERTPPPTLPCSDMTATLQDQYAEPNETRVDLPYRFWDITESIGKDTKQKGELEKKIEHNKNLIRDEMGNATTGVLIDGETAWHWRKTKTGRTLKKGKVKHD